MGFRQRRICRATAEKPIRCRDREGGAPSGGIVGWILATQSDFYRRLTAAIRALASGNSAAFGLAALSFAYGVFHAAGPGHGKAVISAWILANENDLKRGLAMSFAAALLQAVVAVAIVAILGGILRVTAIKMTGITKSIELASFGAVALVGTWLLWRKAGSFARTLEPATGHVHAPGEACGPDCGHLHMPGPELARSSTASMAAAVFAAAWTMLRRDHRTGVRAGPGRVRRRCCRRIRDGARRRAHHRRTGGALRSPRPRHSGSPAVEGRPARESSPVRRCSPPQSCWRSARRCSRASGGPVPPAEFSARATPPGP